VQKKSSFSGEKVACSSEKVVLLCGKSRSAVPQKSVCCAAKVVCSGAKVGLLCRKSGLFRCKSRSAVPQKSVCCAAKVVCSGAKVGLLCRKSRSDIVNYTLHLYRKHIIIKLFAILLPFLQRNLPYCHCYFDNNPYI